MSRIGKQPIEIKSGIEVKVEKNTVYVKGPKGELTVDFKAPISITVEDNKVVVTRGNETKSAKSLHGLYRALVANAVKGVSEGFSKELELKGIGYRAEMKGKDLFMKLGYSHPVNISEINGIDMSVNDQMNIKVEGISKDLVGQTSAGIREKRKVEPYKGKGLRYVDEQVRRKAGKAAKAGA